MDQVQGLASSIGDPFMFGSVAEAFILLGKHAMTMSKQTF